MSATSRHPLLDRSVLPYELPDYAAIAVADYLPAFDAGFAQQRAEVAAITANPEPPTFENTLGALERSGDLLGRVSRTFYTVSSADGTPEVQEIEETVAPLSSAHSDAITLDPALFARIAALYEARDELDLTPEQRYLVERRYTVMSHAGAALDDDAKQTLRDLNARLSVLTTTFERHLLADTNELALHVTDAADLAGLADSDLAAAARAAADRGLDGYLVSLTLFTGHPYLSRLTSRRTRERLLAASRSRGIRGGEHDNRDVLLEIVRLRAQRAELLGYPSHAAYVTSDQTAGSPEAVREMLFRLAAPAARNARVEADALQQIVNETEAAPFEIEAHDWAYYTEKVRAATLDLDTAALRPWFEAERVLTEGVFAAASALYGLGFAERTDLAGYHPDVRVFEVSDADGSPFGLFVFDLYTRDTKRGGAWMNSIVTESALRGTGPVVVNNLNVVKPADGPTLLTLDEVTTLFHEFGHALHGLLARVTYPSFAGTAVYRDFVEFPSQVNEMWIYWPEVLARYARHHETGEPLPADVVSRLTGSQAFNEGFATSEYLAAAWLDQAWHSLSAAEAAAVTDVAAFERAALAEIGLDNPLVPTRYSSTYFAHVFSGGYSAGYYSYIWSEVLDADTVEWFTENGGLTRENGDRFRSRLLGVGGSKDPLEAYRDFRGRDAEVAPLLARRGLTG
ncbi:MULTISPECIES: M3 family metallopeptidase [Microbacterium]|uniref:M3 family metallopeptidase n=1 Tax=Microbacterium TaxID=33882 RepID=UPI0010F4A253|nr:M3 family metallopeptidase [Microbacterium sp. 4NA327F11]MCK9919696.1 M3 family metallopeptidase [Microbacteriaceae bacterium K1510]